MSFAGDRRRDHERFNMVGRRSKLTVVRETEAGWEYADCTLLSLSYGGMRFRTLQPLREGEKYQFLIDLHWPVQGSASVKAVIRWVQALERGGWNVGAEFSESSQGWLGPGEGEEA